MFEEKIKNIVLDLCSEDDYGSWELWWSTRAEFPPDQWNELKSSFLDLLERMIRNKQLITFRHLPDGNTVPTEFDFNRLKWEVDNADLPDRNSYYWFGVD